MEPIIYTIGNEPMITVDIMDINGNWVPITMLLDTGNMRTLVNEHTVHRLGWDITGDGSIAVQGVFGSPTNIPINHEVLIKLGNSKPVMTSIIMATETDMNLLGFDVIQRYFRTTFEGNVVILEQLDSCSECQILGSEGFGQQQPFF